jgi:hypothetical protein
VKVKAMALVLQSYSRWFSSTIRLVSRVSRAGKTKRWCSNDGQTPSSQFGHSVILLQDGLNIEELPIAVRRANSQFLQMRMKNHLVVDNDCSTGEAPSDSIFRKCLNLEAVISKLDEFNIEEVTAPVAHQALARMAELGRNMEYRNSGAELDKSFTLDSVLLQLGTTICKTGTTDNLIGSLQLILLPSFPFRVSSLRILLAENCLNRVLDNLCSVVQVCKIIELFSAMSQPEWADKCWVGLIGRQMTESDILRVFQILTRVKESQRAIFHYVERILVSGINQLDERGVLQILSIVADLNLPHRRICTLVSNWMKLNLHTISEDGIAKLLNLYRRLDHSDKYFVQAVERFFKSRQSTSNRLDEDLIIAASDYFRHFQYCPTVVFNVVADGFSRMGHEKLSVRTVEAVLTAFGLLDFHPDNDFAFWSAAEKVIEKRIVEFRPESLLDVLLSCVYLQRYPMNFIPQVYSSNFINRVHSQTEDIIENCRSKLRLLDAAMSFECGQYGSSYFQPKDYHPKTLPRDGRIIRMINQLVTPIQEICGDQFKVLPSTLLRDLPLNHAYMIDILVSPANEMTQCRYGNSRVSGKRNCLAILIHPPEHYAIHSPSKKTFVGIEAMRHRHLLLMGFQPLHLDWQEVISLTNKKETQLLQSYIDSRLFSFLNDCTRF